MITDANVMAERRADANELFTDEELKMTVRELVIYGDNERSIGFIKSFERPAQNINAHHQESDRSDGATALV